MASTIKLKNGSGAPTAGDLVQGEPALDLTNKRLYTEDAGGTVIEVGTNPTDLTIGGTALTATATELNYTDGVTSNIQTQLNTKAPIASPTFTGTATIPTADINGGTIDDTVIGGTTAAAGSFTSITGTAVTQSSIDTTAGRLLKVGDFGVGADTVPAYDGDLSNSLTTGIYRATTTTTNLPTNIVNDSVIFAVKTNLREGRLFIRTDNTSLIKAAIQVRDLSGNLGSSEIYHTGNDSLINSTSTQKFGTSGTERLRIDSSGNVGIGTTSPAEKLTLGAAGKIQVLRSDNARGGQLFADDTGTHLAALASGNDPLFIETLGATASIRFNTDATERLRITSSGILLVGKTVSDSTASAGIEIQPDSIRATRNSNPVAFFNRRTSDGDIVRFLKDNTTVGSIGITASGLYIDGEASHAGIQFAGDTWIPRQNGSAVDDVVDLGVFSRRFKDLYLSGGVYLGGTAAANHLDDYEEGTWTPSLNLASGSITYSNQVGGYTKIGNKVTLTGWINVTSVSSPTGTLNITLPFTAKNTATRPASMLVANNATGVTGNVGMWINPNTTTGYLVIVNNADISNFEGSNIAAASELYVTITYITA